MSQQDAQNTVMPEKMELTSLNIADHQKQKLKELFPEVFTEGNKIDFDQLKRTLGEMVDGGKERFGMQWAGKADCFKTIQQPSLATLVPCPEESIDFDTTENVFIEGDNLEVLKLLQKSYLGKIKMIYIDPPYNTGKDFIYPDNYSENLDTYLEYTGQIDGEGRKFSTNTDTDGRFHSKWMNMMYPRLFLAKNLLREDGVIFISIDDHEVKNLRNLCDEVFGEENFISCISNTNNPKGRSDDKYIATAHEYVVAYKKSEVFFSGWKPEEKVTKRFNKTDENGLLYREIDLRKTGDGDRREDRENMFYYFYYSKNSKEFVISKEKNKELLSQSGIIEIIPLRADNSEGRWRWGMDTALLNLDKLIAREMPTKGGWSVFEKDYLIDKSYVKPTSSWTDKIFNSERGTEQFISWVFRRKFFQSQSHLA
jgi:adenine-specific DNA-methyltransferase